MAFAGCILDSEIELWVNNKKGRRHALSKHRMLIPLDVS